MENVFDLVWTEGLSYRDVYHQNEVEQSAYNFEHSDIDFLLSAFASHEKQAKYLVEHGLALPAYEQVLKTAHTFNLLDARGAISVTERAAYIGRIRDLARSVAQAYYESRKRLDFPMAPREWVEQLSGESRLSNATRNLLVELLVEELPPKSLKQLGDSLRNVLFARVAKTPPSWRRCAADNLCLSQTACSTYHQRP